MPPIPHIKNISGQCPYLNEEVTIKVEYNELTFLRNAKGNHFTGTDCEYYNDCGFYKKCPLIKSVLNSV